MNNIKKETFSIILRSDKKEKLKKIADKQERSLNNLINKILSEYLENNAKGDKND